MRALWARMACAFSAHEVVEILRNNNLADEYREVLVNVLVRDQREHHSTSVVEIVELLALGSISVVEARKILTPSSRANGWYRYTVSTSVRYVRAPSDLSYTILEVARLLCGFNQTAWATSWSARWPRTVKSNEVENHGCEAVEAALKAIADAADLACEAVGHS